MQDVNGGYRPRTLPGNYDVPRFRLHSEYALSLFSFLMAGAALYANAAAASPLPQGVAAHVPAALFISGLLAPFIQWFYHLGLVASGRFRYYTRLHMIADSTSEDIIHLRESVYELLHSLPYLDLLEVDKAAFVGSSVYLVIRRDITDRIRLGDYLTLLDFSDGMTLGMATVTEIRATQYYAVAQRGMDPVFQGLVAQKGEVSVLPNIKAIYLPREAPNDTAIQG